MDYIRHIVPANYADDKITVMSPALSGMVFVDVYEGERVINLNLTTEDSKRLRKALKKAEQYGN
tara:strand:- start:794 stop:985 length:192 start_codon:yes stop_codon:yes gene_type:complete